jgi:hypothetical protein
MKRRSFLGALAAIPASSALARTGNYITQRAAARVIIDNDFAGDPDGLIALAHQLLSPKARTVLVTTSALDPKLAGLAGLDTGRTAAAGTRLARELLKRLGQPGQPEVVTGAEGFGAGDAQAGAAARAIVAEALRDDPLPLVLTCGGPLTNVAAALRLDPSIARRMTLVWIGGSSAEDGGVEYNLSTDIAAARYVLEQSTVPVWQIPEAEYKRFQVSVAELGTTLRPISPAAQWLYDQYRNLPPFVQLGGSITFGDSPMVSLTAFAPEFSPFTVRRQRRILDDSRYGEAVEGRDIRVYHALDTRLNFADFIAQLRLNAPRQRG